jgi:hypothetical protein
MEGEGEVCMHLCMWSKGDLEILSSSSRLHLFLWRAESLQVFTLPLYLIDAFRSLISKEPLTWLFRSGFPKLGYQFWVQVQKPKCAPRVGPQERAHAFSVLPTNVLKDWGQGFVMATPIPWNWKYALEVCLGSLSIWKSHLRPSFNILTDVLRCCFNIST